MRIMQYYHKKDQYCQTITKPDFSACGTNSACGDELTIIGKIKNNIVTHVSCDCSGCILSQAAAVMLAEKIQGMSIEYVKNFSAHDMQELFDMPVGTNRLSCILLALETVHKALSDVSA